MRKPILCLDFDGVIHSYTSGWKGASVIPDAPVTGAARFILEAHKRFQVAIYSSRSKNILGRWAMQDYVAEMLWDAFLDPETRDLMPEEYIHDWTALDIRESAKRFATKDIAWPWFKPAALMTIDDRALTFDGTWPSLESIASFKPWNKKPA